MEDNKEVTTFFNGDEIIPEEYKPISMWGYCGYELLFNIPVVGLIAILILSFGGTKNKNVKNYAKAQLCLVVIILALLGVIYVIGIVVTNMRVFPDFRFPSNY